MYVSSSAVGTDTLSWWGALSSSYRVYTCNLLMFIITLCTSECPIHTLQLQYTIGVLRTGSLVRATDSSWRDAAQTYIVLTGSNIWELTTITVTYSFVIFSYSHPGRESKASFQRPQRSDV